MRIATTLFIVGVLGLYLCGVAGAAANPGACYVTGAERDARAAKRALVRATVAYREACHVLEATRYYSAHYRPDVGRWTRLARGCHWPWSRIPWLMRQMEQESKGQPCPEGSPDGPLQIIAYWYSSSAQPNAADFWRSKHLPFPWTPTDVRQTFQHALVMDPSNWWIVD